MSGVEREIRKIQAKEAALRKKLNARFYIEFSLGEYTDHDEWPYRRWRKAVWLMLFVSEEHAWAHAHWVSEANKNWEANEHRGTLRSYSIKRVKGT